MVAVFVRRGVNGCVSAYCEDRGFIEKYEGRWMGWIG